MDVFWWYIIVLSTSFVHFLSLFFPDINCFDLKRCWVLWLNLKIMSYLVWISKNCIELYDQQKGVVHVQHFYKFKWFIKNINADISLCVNSFRWTCNGKRLTPILLVRSSQCRYAVRTYYVISYADINFYFKKGPIFIKNHSKCDIQSKINLKCSRTRYARAFWGSFQHLSTLILGYQTQGNLIAKHIKFNVCKTYCTCARVHVHAIYLFYLLFVNGNANNGGVLLRSTPGQKMAVRSTHGQNRAERNTQRWRHPHGNGLWY